MTSAFSNNKPQLRQLPSFRAPTSRKWMSEVSLTSWSYCC